MAKLLKLRRGTTTQHSSFTGAEGEVTVDTDKETLVVHDGSTAGGHPVAAEDMANVSSASITGRLGTGSIATAKIADDAITQAKIADDAVDTAQINNNAVTNSKLTTDAVTGAKIADDSIDSEHIVADSIDSEHYAPNSVDDAALSHALTTSSGTYGSATQIPALTINAQGRITAASVNTVNTTTNLGTSTASGSVTITSSTGNNATINEASGSAAGVMSVAHHDKLDGIAAGATNVTTENIQDIVGNMVSSNSESGITVTYQDSDGTLDFSVGTLNQNTTGNAGTATQLQTARTIAGSSFNGTANINISYNNLTNKPTIPTNTNQLTNGAGFITSANDTSKMPLAGGEFTGDVIAHNIRPDGSSRDLGTSSYRWNNVYTNDLHLSNEGSSNDVDGSWGDWTIQEGESDLFLKNNRSGKKYKFNLTEVS